MQTAGSVNADEHYDVIVIGAGFAGLYALHRLRALGLRARVLEQADRVGGTWLWNRYPGARCDIESIEYSYSFSDEIQQEWSWTQTLPAQPEVEAYLNFVADRLDLRRDIQFSTRVAALDFDEAAGRWHITTDASQGGTSQRDVAQRDAAQHFTAQFVIAATGILSAPLDPAIPGKDAFNGTSLYCARFPHGGFDFTGLRVGLIGTGSTGVQATPVIAEQADQLYVFQRSAAYTFPSNLREFDPGELDALKARYPEIREAQRQAHTGAARLSAFSVMSATRDPRPLKQATREEQLRAIEERGVAGALTWADVLFDPEAGEIATKLYGEAVARIVKDPDTAASLVPHYPFGCRRPIIDTGYYEAFNRPNVTLVDLRKSPLRQVTPTGIETEQDRYNLDVIVYATGFDAMTGALTRIDIRGRNGALLRDVWADGGPLTYLGLQVAGFPNLFTVQGPSSTAVTSNYVTGMEAHIDWIADCLTYLRSHGHHTIEALPAAQQEWAAHAASLTDGTILSHPACKSWWTGTNIPGKQRFFLGYVGGVPDFRRRCNAVAAAGYTGFALS